ncbi:MAG: pyruvate dehydrogenase complex dihydrolipoamide acetyltransferase [Gemmatimonadetes bacterium]|nr:pyruvate dehydrogenase complex dihydrolipoamide acetyltransferase [Gemmatimonadota bacterium]MSR35058.1 pyruvate dehydrogenase complex dihydrolipoamide acetyltransferase [Gemmatimonadota bacterium]
MEALSPTMDEGQLVQWLRSEGDQVASGDVLAEIETDKATMELVARGDGILRKIFVGAGGVAPVGSVIAVIAGKDEDISSIQGPAGGAGGAVVAKPAQEAVRVEGAPVRAPAARTAPAPAAVEAIGNGGRVKASPLARRLAEDMGVDISRVQGSGPGGRVVKRDIEAAKTAGVPAPSVTVWIPDEAEYQDVPTSQMRKTIAKRLATSIGPVPTFYLTVDVDMSRVIEARASINAMLEAEGLKVSINDIVLKAVAAALRRHPECNAQWHDGFVRRFNSVHLGVAVAIDDGLITPVVKNAHAKGIAQMSAEVRELAGRARERKLVPEEYTGSTFSVSNLGMLGIHEFTAIINPPEAGILAIGAMEETPVVIDGAVTVRPRMRITMSCDHRVIDGALGARYLQTLRAMLEEPTAILL